MIINYNDKYHSQVEDIFWQTSSVSKFRSPEEKESFRYKYLDFYLNHKDLISSLFIKDDKVLGYIIGILNHDEKLFSLHSHLEKFKDLILDYPTELHINLMSNSQGQGIGKLLLENFEEKVSNKEGTGIHLFTLRSARNYSFYTQNLYSPLHYEGDLVLLAKNLST